MLITTPNPKYKAQYVGTKLSCYHNDRLMATIKVKSILDARAILNDWARLNISIEDVVHFRKIAKNFVGCTVDDIRYAADGETVLINGKQVEHI